MSATIEIVQTLVGVLVGTGLSLAFIMAVTYWQYYEYRRQWPHGLRLWVVQKLLTLASGGLLIALAFLIASGVSGMEALGIFYLGLFLGLAAGPFTSASVGRLLGVPFRDALRVSGSLVAVLLVYWFSGASLANAYVNISGVDYAAQKEYLAFKHAADHAATADGAITLADQQMLRLNDGRRLIHLAFHIAPGYQIHAIEVQMHRSWGGNDKPFFNSTVGQCFSIDTLHLTNVLDSNESLEVRLRFHKGTPDSMVEYRAPFSFPAGAAEGFLDARRTDDAIRFPVPLPANSVWLMRDKERIPATVLLPAATDGGLPGTPADSRCIVAPLLPVTNVDHVVAALYSEELYKRIEYFLNVVD
jgi:hypothetical protein